jgi:hypothetical protein
MTEEQTTEQNLLFLCSHNLEMKTGDFGKKIGQYRSVSLVWRPHHGPGFEVVIERLKIWIEY